MIAKEQLKAGYWWAVNPWKGNLDQRPHIIVEIALNFRGDGFVVYLMHNEVDHVIGDWLPRLVEHIPIKENG